MEAQVSTLSRGQRAIVFTDVVDSTFRTEKSGERMVGLIRRDLAAIRELVAKNGGTIAKKTGDGVLALFPETLQAFTFAEALREYMRDNMTKFPPDEVLKHKIGIHYGEVFVADEDAYGNEVNLAARVTASVPVGSIGISAMALNRLPSGRKSGALSLGQLRLKGISELVEVWEFPDPDRQRPLIRDYDSRPSWSRSTGEYDLPARKRWPVALLFVAACLVGAYYAFPKERERLMAQAKSFTTKPTSVNAKPLAKGDKVTKPTAPVAQAAPKPVAAEPPPYRAAVAVPLTADTALAKRSEYYGHFDFAGFADWLADQPESKDSKFSTILNDARELADLKESLPGRIARITPADAVKVNLEAGPAKFFGDDTGPVVELDGQTVPLDLDTLRPDDWRNLLKGVLGVAELTAEDRAKLEQQIGAFNRAFL